MQANEAATSPAGRKITKHETAISDAVPDWSQMISALTEAEPEPSANSLSPDGTTTLNADERR